MYEILSHIKQQDTSWFYTINSGFHNPLFDALMPALSRAADGGILWIVFSLALLLFGGRELKKASLLMLAALLGSFIIGDELLKNVVQRPRPFMAIPGVDLLVVPPHSYSFPSGHAAAAFAVWLVVARKIPPLSLPVVVLAAAIAFSRVYVGVHYPLDVLTGGVLGLLTALLVLRLERMVTGLPRERLNRNI
ncbi:MAG: phosphatase PAP2 family protein [Firmicutes bacterium]|nr:phosphatase PAP2 family protein [Bacillota bacterium]